MKKCSIMVVAPSSIWFLHHIYSYPKKSTEIYTFSGQCISAALPPMQLLQYLFACIFVFCPSCFPTLCNMFNEFSKKVVYKTQRSKYKKDFVAAAARGQWGYLNKDCILYRTVKISGRG